MTGNHRNKMLEDKPSNEAPCEGVKAQSLDLSFRLKNSDSASY